MKYFILFAAFTISFSSMAQSVFDDYKYIVVPKRFASFKKENQYQTSTLVKHLLTENGFTAVYEDALPEDLLINRCMGLYVKLNDNSSMFSTKASVSFEDCSSKEIYITEEGKSKEKEYKLSFSEAIRKAMKSLEVVNYTYKEPVNEPIKVSYKNDVKKIGNTAQESTSKVQKTQVVQQEATKEVQSYKSVAPVKSNFKKAVKNIVPLEFNSEEVLYAQEITNGYQLVDSTPKVRLKVYKTSVKDVYLATSGIIYGKEGKWYYEYYTNDVLTTKELNIKF
ncbi:hypothetical protein CLV91_0089 [Maribacter vaceletii]|uniref:Uncharacterized protein n=1 Tax=Maribacter vaceletii TaxID=1206816 RepID=A0A495EAY6_9FLAO|nr:hypothetical protein [Maribacter vaceletii]RKR14020.1 hypothetical protein CLV91_0089 [Maribacter vaceletii]